MRDKIPSPSSLDVEIRNLISLLGEISSQDLVGRTKQRACDWSDIREHDAFVQILKDDTKELPPDSIKLSAAVTRRLNVLLTLCKMGDQQAVIELYNAGVWITRQLQLLVLPPPGGEFQNPEDLGSEEVRGDWNEVFAGCVFRLSSCGLSDLKKYEKSLGKQAAHYLRVASEDLAQDPSLDTSGEEHAIFILKARGEECESPRLVAESIVQMLIAIRCTAEARRNLLEVSRSTLRWPLLVDAFSERREKRIQHKLGPLELGEATPVRLHPLTTAKKPRGLSKDDRAGFAFEVFIRLENERRTEQSHSGCEEKSREVKKWILLARKLPDLSADSLIHWVEAGMQLLSALSNDDVEDYPWPEFVKSRLNANRKAWGAGREKLKEGLILLLKQTGPSEASPSKRRSMQVISNKAWVEFESALRQGKYSPAGARGTISDRQFVEAVVHLVRTGGAWRGLPQSFGSWSAIYTRFARWEKRSVWKKLWLNLNAQHLFLARAVLVEAFEMGARFHDSSGLRTPANRLSAALGLSPL